MAKVRAYFVIGVEVDCRGLDVTGLKEGDSIINRLTEDQLDQISDHAISALDDINVMEEIDSRAIRRIEFKEKIKKEGFRSLLFLFEVYRYFVSLN